MFFIDRKIDDVEKMKKLTRRGKENMRSFCFPHISIIDVFGSLIKKLSSENWMDLSVEELPSVLYFIFKVAQETGKIETNSCQFDATSNQLKELYFKFPLKPHEIEYNSSFLDDKFNFLQSLREKKCIGKEVWE